MDQSVFQSLPPITKRSILYGQSFLLLRGALRARMDMECMFDVFQDALRQDARDRILVSVVTMMRLQSILVLSGYRWYDNATLACLFATAGIYWDDAIAIAIAFPLMQEMSPPFPQSREQ